ncbi:MAG: hypothetical protein JWN70_1907 [Planctomycetaceae bacterium]|nr:hypothetical protein [Planctomycetaceae bacterium]
MLKQLSLSGLVLICGLLLTVPGQQIVAADQAVKEEKPAAEAEPKPAAKLDQAELEKEFEKTMSGSVLVGRFTVVGKENEEPKEERYTITKVKKQDDGEWIFLVRIQYGKNDNQVPLKLKVEWAGDTPVITLTDLTIPGMGTFTSRVLIYRGWYAGTWQHGKVGGHLFGRIEKLTEEKKTEKKPAEEKKSAEKTNKE